MSKTVLQKWFKDSETILVARLASISGFITAAVAGLNWDKLFSFDFTNGFNKQILIPSGLVFFQGIATEAARRRRTSSDPVT